MLLICLSRHLKRPSPALLPKPLGDLEGFDIEVVPPSHLIARLMQLAMMVAT
jgi:hypothetical protein